MKKLISLFLALALLVSCAFCEETTEPTAEPTAEVAAEEAAAEETVDPSTVELMTLGGKPVYLSQAQQYAELLYENSYIDSADDLLSGLEYVLRYVVGMELLVSEPSQWLTEEEIASITEEKGTYYDEVIQSYVDYYAGDEATDDDKAALALEAVEYYGITRDEYIQDNLTSEAYNAMLNTLADSVTDEEVEAVYNEEAEYEMNALAETAAYYGVSVAEIYDSYTSYGYSFYFMPEGYRGILHILMTADDELLAAYTSAETEEDKAAAAEAIIASKQDTIDAIYAAFNAGTPFTDLIAQYNEDPGMQDETYLAEGYSVRQDNAQYVSEFTEGAFSEKMQQPGDISDPVVSSYGVHIMYYLRDIPSGILPMTDEARETFTTYALQKKQSECADEALKAFEVTYTDAYTQYIGEENFLDK